MKKLITTLFLILFLVSCSSGSSGGSSSPNTTSPVNPIPSNGIPFAESVFKDLPAYGSSDCEIQNNTAFRSFVFKTSNGIRVERDVYASGSDCNVEINYTSIVEYQFQYSLNPDGFTDKETIVLSVIRESLVIYNNAMADYYEDFNYFQYSVWKDFVKNDITCRFQSSNVNQALCAGLEFQWFLELDRINSNFRLDNINYF